MVSDIRSVSECGAGRSANFWWHYAEYFGRRNIKSSGWTARGAVRNPQATSSLASFHRQYVFYGALYVSDNPDTQVLAGFEVPP